MKVHKPDLQAFLPHQVDQEGQEDPVCRREEALTLNAAKLQVCTPPPPALQMVLLLHEHVFRPAVLTGVAYH